MKVLKDAKWVSSSVFFSALLSSVRSIIVLRLLGPVLMGAWKTALLVDTLSEISRAGVLRGMAIRVPVLSGQGNIEEADKNAAAAGGFLTWLGLFSCCVILGASFFVADANVRLALRYMALAVGIGQPYYFIRELTGNRHLFGLRASETVLRTVIDVVVSIILCRVIGLAGLGLGSVLSVVGAGIFLITRQRIPLDLSVPRPRLMDMMRIGVPFSLTEAGYELFRRVDVFLIAIFLGPTQVGFYGISIMIMDFAALLADKGVSQVLSPHLLKEYGRTGSHSDVANYYEMPVRLFCYVLPPLLAIGTLLIGPLVHLFLPQYTAGIASAEITLWCVMFVALHFSVHAFFVASDMVTKIIKLQTATLFVALVLQASSLKLGYGIVGAAWCTLAVAAGWAALELSVARRACGHSVTETLSFLFVVYMPFVACFALRHAVDFFVSDATQPFLPVLRACSLLLCYLPLFFLYENKFSMVRTVRQAI